jgi:hypothetical protein
MHQMCERYRETIMVTMYKTDGTVEQRPMSHVSDVSFETMVDYLSNDSHIGNWMRYQQDFDDDVENLLRVIRRAEQYVEPKVAPVVVEKKRLDFVEKFRGCEADVPSTPLEIKALFSARKKVITTKQIRNWAQREFIKSYDPLEGEGKRKRYLPSEVMDVYNEKVTKLKDVA